MIWVSIVLVSVDVACFGRSDSVVHSSSNLENDQGKCELQTLY